MEWKGLYISNFTRFHPIALQGSCNNSHSSSSIQEFLFLHLVLSDFPSLPVWCAWNAGLPHGMLSPRELGSYVALPWHLAQLLEHNRSSVIFDWLSNTAFWFLSWQGLLHFAGEGARSPESLTSASFFSFENQNSLRSLMERTVFGYPIWFHYSSSSQNLPMHQNHLEDC